LSEVERVAVISTTGSGSGSARLRAADTLLLGATTYLGLKAYWPAVAENPALSPAVVNNPDVADVHREIGQRNNEIPKVVVSDS
jgi:hypothetical protein